MFTSMDVYDAASAIGRECQFIVSEYGPEVVQNLMPKVISMLEELEHCAVYCEKEKDEISHLQQLAEELRRDCRTQAELKEKCDQNLEQLEQSWYCETQKLLEQVTNLEEENNRLAQQLASEVSAAADDPDLSAEVDASATELSTANKPGVSSVLRAAIAGKTEAVTSAMSLAAKTRPNKLASEAREELIPVDMISSVLSETEERLQMSEQERKTWDRAADLQLIGRLKECVAANHKAIRGLGREMVQVNAALDAAEEEVCRLARQSGQIMASRAPHRRQMGQLVAEKANIEAQLRLKERDLAELNLKFSLDPETIALDAEKPEAQKSAESPTRRFDSKMGTQLSSNPGAVNDSPSEVTQADSEGLVSLEELRHLLYERNELRCRLIELQEELEILERENAKDPDVEGPMWLEPAEKLRPNMPSKPDIKTIFRKLLQRLTEGSVDDD